MKNALILHGTNGYSGENWFPWIRKELEKKKWNIWVPDLPYAEKPSIKRWTEYIFQNTPWAFDSESYLIGHSAGCAAVLGLLQRLPDDVVVDTCILVAPFEGNLNWNTLDELFDIELDFSKIKKQAKRFIILSSDDDPYVPAELGKNVAKKVHGEFILKHASKHFSISTGGEEWREFPYLLEIIH